VGTPVTWRGFYAPAGRWLSATAELVDDLLQVSFREAADLPAEGPTGPADEPLAATGEDADHDRLRFLAEVSEALITTLDRGESAGQLAELAVRRLADWAVVMLAGEDGGPEEVWAHRDPARRADLDSYMTGRLRDTGDDAAMVDALLTGEPVQVTTIQEERVAPSLPTDEVRAAWRRLDTTSCTIVPLRDRGDLRRDGADERRCAAAAQRDGDRHRRRGRPPRRPGARPRPPLRPSAEGRRNAAAQPAHPAPIVARPRAVALPMPPVPPVISTVLPAISPS
jgi:hypothetical protein